MLVQNYPPFRACRFCLSLQEGSVFADFDVDEESRVFLRRISFDGYGCCTAEFKKMSADDSRVLLDSIDRDAAENARVGDLLRSYFRENSEAIWSDALTDHELL
jgi:hypothetical protein